MSFLNLVKSNVDATLSFERRKLKAFQQGYKDAREGVYPQPHNSEFPSNYMVGWNAGDKFRKKVLG